MGIQGLLPFLKNASKPANIKSYKGCTVAIDSYCWLHRGAFACAEKLAVGQETDQYVHYCMKYVNNLLSFDIKPIMVFDGCHLPSKKEVEKQRRERRVENRKKAKYFLQEGMRKEARDALVKCIDITPEMALNLMKACRARGVDCIVAPYEADAQLAYLSKTGIAQVIITEDSDLILFGCERIMFKMDFAGNGTLVEQNDLNQAMGFAAEHFTFEKFRYMCILSGCDYLPNLPNVGLVRACKALKLTRQTDVTQILKKLPMLLKSNSLVVDSSYIEGFLRANNTFLYQLVYDPMKRRLLPLNPYPSDLDASDMSYAGPWLSDELSWQIALGNINIHTEEKMADFNPDKCMSTASASHLLSIWDPQYTPMSKSGPVTAEEKRPSTKGLEFTARVTVLNNKASSGKRKLESDEPERGITDIQSMYHSASTVTASPPPAKKRQSTENLSTCLDHVDEDMTSNLKPLRTKTDDQTVSPRLTPKTMNKNIFAVKSPPSRGSFNLNAKKSGEKVEVRSRFFSASKPKMKTNFFKKLDEKHESAKTSEMKHFVFHGSQDELSQTTSQVDDEDVIEEITENTTQEQADESLVVSRSSSTESCDMPSSSQSCNSSVFSKLSGFKSKFGNKSSIISSSKNARKQFKPVSLSQNLAGSRGERSEKMDLFGSSQDSEISEVSHGVSLYSFDSQNWMLSQNLDEETESSSQTKLPELPRRPRSPSPDSRSSAESVTFVEEIPSVNKSQTISASQPQLKKSPSIFKSNSQPSLTSNKSAKGKLKCKAVGLSKRNVKSKADSENQPGISKYFNFAYQKRNVEKLPPPSRSPPLSPSKINVIA